MTNAANPSLARELRAQRAARSDSALAAAYGISRQRVHQLCGPRPKRAAQRRADPPAGPTRAAFAAALLAWRVKHGFSQAEAARVLRVNKMSISQWERQATACSLAAAIMLLLERLP